MFRTKCSKFTGYNTAWKPAFERLTKMLLKVCVSMTSSPPSAFSNVVRMNKHKIKYAYKIVVVSIAMVAVITKTYFL